MFKSILIILNIIVALSMLTIHFATAVNPQDFWPFAFLGLIYPIFFIFNIIFLLVWLFTPNKLLALISFIALLISYKSNIATFQFSIPAKNVEEISLMTWNVKNFDLYNWSGNEETRAKMFDLLKENRPDILCLQEFYTEDKGKFKNLKDLKKELNYKYEYFAKTYTIDDKRHWGLVIFSDKKIVDTGKLLFEEGTLLNTCMYADIALSATQNVRIYNLHLQSNQLSAKDVHLLEEIDNQEAEKAKNTLIGIVRKMRKGYINRAKQVQQVQQSKAQSPYPSIIIGDFNDVPVSYTYKQLSKGMQDAYVKKGSGFGKTFSNKLPYLRIDYILLHNMFNINKYEVLEAELSDHYPVVVKFRY